MTRRSTALAAALSLSLTANARAEQVTAPGFALSRFEPSERGSWFFGTESLDWRTDGLPTLGLVADYSWKPLVAYRRVNGGSEEIIPVVRHHLLGHLGGTLNLGERFRVGLTVPVVLVGQGESVQVGLEKFRPPEPLALGDIRLGGDWRFYGSATDRFRAGLGARLYLPTGNPLAYAGDSAFRAVVQAEAAGNVTDSIEWSARLGYHQRFREVTFAGGKVGPELQLGLGAGWRGLDGKLLVGPELYTATGVSSGALFNGLSTPVDLLVGAHYQFLPQWRAGLALSRGFTDALGEPSFRAVGSLEWVPAPAVAPAAPVDSDGDGIADAQDACPTVKGVANADAAKNGCPADSDGDGIIDAEDACPTVKGVANADAAKNGCPADSDGDGIIDAEDACPTVKGVAEEKGCPAKPADTDGDGIPDAQDACPAVKGVASSKPEFNGCPADLDADSIVNTDDACPKEAGAKHADPKKNGCPVGAVVAGQLVLDQVKFDTNKATIRPESNDTLNKVLEVIQKLPETNRYRVEGHTDNQGKPAYNKGLSQRRAQAVVDWLVKKGLSAKRFEAKGFGQEKPIATNETDAGRQANRRVEMHILEGTNLLPAQPAPAK